MNIKKQKKGRWILFEYVFEKLLSWLHCLEFGWGGWSGLICNEDGGNALGTLKFELL